MPTRTRTSVVNFGLVASLTVALAFVADVTLTPALLALTIAPAAVPAQTSEAPIAAPLPR